MKIVRERWGLSRGQAILFGLRSRANSYGFVRSLLKTCYILAADSFRSLLIVVVRVALLFPLSLLKKVNRAFRQGNISKVSSD